MVLRKPPPRRWRFQPPFTAGFAWINSILRDNADAAYYGKAVGPNDQDKVLLRWKLDDGNYRVIYGDLKSETVTAERLKAIESR